MSVTLENQTPREPVAPGRERYLAHSDHLMMVVLDLTDGPAAQPDPHHSHPHEQITYVVEGRVRFFIGDQPHDLSPGDMIVVASNLPHTIQTLSPRVRLIDTFSPIREDFLNKGRS
jgi:quercetin dioxygenase-like cupin family protein